MTATDQLRAAIRDLEAKARELDLDKKIETFADQADHFLRTAATRAADLAAENRERIDASLAKAGSAVDRRTDGKYAEYVGKVRSGLMNGVDWVSEQREPASAGPRPEGTDAGAATTATTAAAAPTTDSPPSSPHVATDDVTDQSLLDRTADEGITSEGAWAEATDTERPARPTDS
jgi:ElaB/YqjD/DUF883 family membrane-anchored ribosome-binding protein